MEDVLPKKPFAGLIYTFIYKGPNSSVGKISFVDYMPMILCCGYVGDYIYGINLNYLPGDYRAVLFDMINDTNNNFFTEDGLYDAQRGMVSICQELFKTLVFDDGRKAFFELYKSKCGVDLYRAYRKYNIKNIENLRFVEYPLYKYIPLLSHTDAIKGADILMVQKSVVSK